MGLRHGQRVCRGDDLGPDLEEREQVVEIQRLAGDLRETDQQSFQQLAQAAEAAGQERQVADAEIALDRAPGDVGIGEVVAQRPQRGQQRAPDRAAAGEGAVGAIELVGQLAVSGDQVAVEVEDLHLLRRLHAGAHLAHVFELASFRRPGVVERVAQRVEMRLADERRHQRHRQQHDQPWRVDQQAGGEADHGDRILHLAEQLAHQVHAAHRLATRAIELVLQVGILEVLQVQRRRMLHQAHAGGVGEQFRQQRVAVADQAAEQVGTDRQRELDHQQPRQRFQLAAAPGGADRIEPHAGRDQAHRLVDDQLADVERRDRQERADHAQTQRGQRQRGAGGPDLAEEGRQVAQRVEAFAQGRFSGGDGFGHGRGIREEAARFCLFDAQVR